MVEIPNFSSLPEKYAAENSAIDNQVEKLGQHISSPYDNLYVRGSFVRGDSPYGDIDVSAYNYGGGYVEKKLPQEFEGISISYGFIPLEHLEEYFEHCLRGTSSLMEMRQLTLHDAKPSEIVARQQEKFLMSRRSDYLLFLRAEEAVSRKRHNAENSQEYEDIKRKAGSKRTVSRILWSYKTLFPELYGIFSTKETFNELVEAGVLPQVLADDAQKVLSGLANLPRNDSDFEERRKRISDWFDLELKIETDKKIRTDLPKYFVESVEVGLDPKSTSSELSEVFDYSLGNLDSYRRWMALFTLSANEKLSSQQLVEILHLSRGNYTYSNIVRNLLRNTSFPVSAIRHEDISEDIYAKNEFNKRLQKNS